jgi:pimeloyl-ACP methyl ester carboxylesterase
MKAIAGLLLFLSAAASAADSTIHFSRHDALVRSGILFRCCVQRDVPSEEFNHGPITLVVALAQGSRTIAVAQLPLVKLGQLLDGVSVALVPGELGGDPLHLRASLSTPDKPFFEKVEVDLDPPLGKQDELQKLFERLKASADTDPLPWLWVEQGAALSVKGASKKNLRDLAALNQLLANWLEQKPPPPPGPSSDQILAIRDPIDGSIQPYRLRMPPAMNKRVPVVLVLSHYDRAPDKESWRGAGDAWAKCAGQAGFALVDIYPAGDIAWEGIALSRALLVLDDLPMQSSPIEINDPILIGVDNGAQGAVRLLEKVPDRFAGLALVSGRMHAFTQNERMDWHFLRRYAGGLPENAEGTPILEQGDSCASVRAWLESARGYGGIVIPARSAPDSPEFWQQLAQAQASKPPLSERSYTVLRPQRIGNVVVEEMEKWGSVGSVNWITVHPPRVQVFGIHTLLYNAAPRDLIVNEQPYKPPKDLKRALRKVFGQACGPLDNYAQAPFVIVYATGEHKAAADMALALANDFRGAWITHAQGAPPMVADTAFDETAFPGFNIVAVGNPRSNVLLMRLSEQGLKLPLAWSGREISYGELAVPRGDRNPVALAWPHPAGDGRLLVVLDGGTSWKNDGSLPLAGLSDLVIGATAQNQPPVIMRLFNSDWR